jgi:iron complex outermembrane receptor protein
MSMKLALAGASLVALGLSLCPLHPAVAAAPVDGAEAAAPAAPSAFAPEEQIVVTAQRRSEQLMKVPATITVLGQRQLQAANVTNSLDLPEVTPGLSMAPLGGFTQPVLRGITTVVPGVGNPPNVALYIDGVYITAQDAYDFQFVGIDRIEVLKGPQGTLYGRNATGGAILVTTKKPQFDWSGNAKLTYGSYNDREAEGFITGPIADKLAFSLSALARADDGYFTNITTGNDKVGKNHRESVRGSLLFKPSDRAEFRLNADYTFVDDPRGWDSSTLNRNTQALRTNPTTVISSKRNDVNLTFDPTYTVRNGGVSLDGDIDLGIANLKTVTSYRDLKGLTIVDVDYNPLPQSSQERHFFEKDFGQEADFSSTNTGPLTWIAGLQYAHENSKNDPLLQNNVVTARNVTLTNYYSGFVDLTYHITRTLVLTGGARYSDERKAFTARTGNPADAPLFDSTKSHAWTPRATLRYSPDDELSIYASYNKGFKSGGYNSSSSNSLFNGKPTPFLPESIVSYEVGLRKKFGNLISIELSAFDSKIKDMQVALSVSVGGTPQSLVANAAAARIYGGEALVVIRPLAGLSASIGAAYTHARYTSFPNALVTAPLPGGGNSQFIVDASGYKLVRNPTFTSTFSVDYERKIGSNSVFISANVYHSSGYYYGFTDRLHQGEYDLLNGRIGYGFAHDKFRVSVFGKNITNTNYASLLLDSPTGDRLIYGAPRTIGVELQAKF